MMVAKAITIATEVLPGLMTGVNLGITAMVLVAAHMIMVNLGMAVTGLLLERMIMETHGTITMEVALVLMMEETLGIIVTGLVREPMTVVIVGITHHEIYYMHCNNSNWLSHVFRQQ